MVNIETLNLQKGERPSGKEVVYENTNIEINDRLNTDKVACGVIRKRIFPYKEIKIKLNLIYEMML